MTDPYTYRTYRLVWRTLVYPVDQYGIMQHDQKPFYDKEHPTQEEALADLNRVAKPHPHVEGRYVSDLAPHDYHDCHIGPDQVLVREWKEEASHDKP